MDKVEGIGILKSRLDEYRTWSHDRLRSHMGGPIVLEARGRSGTDYQIEIEVFWDDKEGGDLRVLGSIDDGGARAFCPLCDSFIVTP